ncbi:unnamed protein product [Amoebophrya sp. A120]|nr:unnamed protein product [Amoebophrya sp. A120]|eukprot:GSA120T00008157001.1
MAARGGIGRGHPSNVGMMDAAFFVGRSELLHWANERLLTSLSKVEQCASGAIYCQLLDACHPGGVVQMKRVNWTAKVDHEYIPNYKILQAAFDKMKIDRNIDVDKLIKGKYQDNLEFLQWMKCYYDHTFAGLPYDPIERRDGKALFDWARPGGMTTGQSMVSEPSNSRRPAQRAVSRSEGGQKSASSSSSSSRAALPSTAPSGAGGAGKARIPASQRGDPREVESLREELRNMQVTVDGLETERDYYFHKLREIEILSQTLDPEDPTASHTIAQMTVPKLVKEVQQILYKEEGPAEGAGG